jgi:hypothetical protein
VDTRIGRIRGRASTSYPGHSATPAFLKEIARRGETDFAALSVNTFEIVRTGKFFSKAGTEIMARVVHSPR